MNNYGSKSSFVKSATTVMHGRSRRHSSHPTAMDYSKATPAMLKIGATTALPIMLYHQFIPVQEQLQSDATDEQQFSDDDEGKIPDWQPKKMSCEDASLHISR